MSSKDLYGNLLYSYLRQPLTFEPELVLGHAGVGSLSAVMFLHENYLSFICEDRIDIVALVADYLSDAGKFCGQIFTSCNV